MDADEALAMSGKIGLIITMCRGLPADEVAEWAKIAREEKSRHDTWGSMVDPTGYMRERDAVDATNAVAQAFKEFHTRVMENVNVS